MVLAVRKNLQMNNIIMLVIFYYLNFPRKSVPGEVLALGLLLGAFGDGLGPDGPG